MSELTRRDLLRLGATGLAAVSMGGLTVLSAKPARAECLPAGPTRYENSSYIVCPDDYDGDREYSAVFSKKDGIETIIDWGYGYTPFDGSWYNSPPEAGKLHYLRAICGNQVLESTEGVWNLTSEQRRLSISSKECPSVRVPEVQPLKVLSYVVGGGHGRPKVILARPNNPLVPPTNNPDRARLAAAQIVFYEFINRSGRPWKREGDVDEPEKRFLLHSNIVQSSTSNQNLLVSPGDVLNGGALPEFTVPKGNTTYHFFAEVLYDFGGTDPSCRFRAARSEILQVDGSGRKPINIGEYPPGHGPKKVG